MLDGFWTYAFAEESVKAEFFGLLGKLGSEFCSLKDIREALTKLPNYHSTLRPGGAAKLQQQTLSRLVEHAEAALGNPGSSSEDLSLLQAACLDAKKITGKQVDGSHYVVERDTVQKIEEILERVQPKVAEASQKMRQETILNILKKMCQSKDMKNMLEVHEELKQTMGPEADNNVFLLEDDESCQVSRFAPRRVCCLWGFLVKY